MEVAKGALLQRDSEARPWKRKEKEKKIKNPRLYVTTFTKNPLGC
jgi:hypothetical protein